MRQTERFSAQEVLLKDFDPQAIANWWQISVHIMWPVSPLASWPQSINKIFSLRMMPAILEIAQSFMYALMGRELPHTVSVYLGVYAWGGLYYFLLGLAGPLVVGGHLLVSRGQTLSAQPLIDWKL